jgi:hypothetical protein
MRDRVVSPIPATGTIMLSKRSRCRFRIANKRSRAQGNRGKAAGICIRFPSILTSSTLSRREMLYLRASKFMLLSHYFFMHATVFMPPHSQSLLLPTNLQSYRPQLHAISLSGHIAVFQQQLAGKDKTENNIQLDQHNNSPEAMSLNNDFYCEIQVLVSSRVKPAIALAINGIQ